MARQIKLRRDQQKARRAQRAFDDTADDVRRTIDLDLHSLKATENCEGGQHSPTHSAVAVGAQKAIAPKRRRSTIRDRAAAARVGAHNARRGEVGDSNAAAANGELNRLLRDASHMPSSLNQAAIGPLNGSGATGADEHAPQLNAPNGYSTAAAAKTASDEAPENALAAALLSSSAATVANVGAFELIEHQMKVNGSE